MVPIKSTLSAPATFVLRSQFHALAGFSPMKSRIFSGLLILMAFISASVFVNRWSGLSRWQQLLVIAQVGLTPVMIYTARSTRMEQEVLFFGWIGAIVLPSWIPMIANRPARAMLWIISGLFVGWSANSHPFGFVFCLVGIWLLLTAKKWAEQDGFRLWQRIGLLGSGVLLVCIPTVLWIVQSWDHFREYAEMQRDLYAVRETELIDFYAAQAPFARFDHVLAKPLIARLNVLYSASYEDYFSYPVPNYRFRWLFEIWFIGLFTLVVAYFIYSLCRRFRTNDHWLLLLVLLSMGFVGFQLWYPPATTYKPYVSYFVYLTGSLVLWKLITKLYDVRLLRVAAITLAASYVVATGFVLHYSVMHLKYVMQAYARGDFPNVSLDQEFDTLKKMSRSLAGWRRSGRLHVHRKLDCVRQRHSFLWESVMLGLVKPRDADGVVFKSPHELQIGYQRRHGLQVPDSRTAHAIIEHLVARMRLTGLIISDFTPEGAYCFYSKR